MKKRNFLTATLVVLLILSITAFFITPASACRRKPKVEIWKKFLDTSDPPPYQMNMEYHWDIELGVWTSIDLRCAKVYDRFGAELKIDYIQTPDKTYTFTYLDYETKYPTKQAYVSISDGTTTITHKLDWRGVRFGEEPYKFRIYWSGKTHKIHFQWYIGNLGADETIKIIIGVSTDLNPGGQQEYTSPCEHCINSGAVLKAKYKYRSRCRRRWRCISAESEKLCIKVQCEEPLPAKLLIRKFKDIENIGIYDEGVDELITGWEIYVTEPGSGTPILYSTPVELVVTNFGTYTVTESLPAGWEQTAVAVDGVYIEPPTLTVTVNVNEGETHKVLYGNRETPPPPAELIIEKFIDPNGNGVLDAGEEKIAGWRMDVMTPSGVVATFLTTVPPTVIEITEFGTYTITEDLPGDWEQTVVLVDGILQPLDPTVTVLINPGETHNVLYGNREIPPPPSSVEITLGIMPNIQRVGLPITFSWNIDSSPALTPVKVELKLINPYSAETIIYTGSTFPDDLTGSRTWTATGPTGSWKARVIYHYSYMGFDLTATATQGFIVLPST